MDRYGRLMSDLAPHIAAIGAGSAADMTSSDDDGAAAVTVPPSFSRRHVPHRLADAPGLADAASRGYLSLVNAATDGVGSGPGGGQGSRTVDVYIHAIMAPPSLLTTLQSLRSPLGGASTTPPGVGRYHGCACVCVFVRF